MTSPSTDGFGVMPSATWFPKQGQPCAGCLTPSGPPSPIEGCDCDQFCGHRSCGANPDVLGDLRASLGRRLGLEHQS